MAKKGFGFVVDLEKTLFSRKVKEITREIDKAFGADLVSASKVATAALGGITAAMGAVFAASMNFGAKMDTLQTALDNTWKSAGEAAKQYDNLRKIAENSDFGMAALVQADKTMAALGFNAKDSAEVIKRLGDTVVALGGGEAELKQMSDALLKMKTSGSVSAKQLEIFAKAGIKVSDVIGMDATNAINILIDRMSALDGVMENESSDIWAQWSRLVEISQDALGSLGNYINDNFKMYFKGLVDIVSDARDEFKSLLSNPDGIRAMLKELGYLAAAVGTVAIPALANLAVVMAPVVLKTAAIMAAVYALRTAFKDVFDGPNNLGKVVADWAVVVEASVDYLVSLFKQLPKIMEKKFKEAVIGVDKLLRDTVKDWFGKDMGPDWLVEELKVEVKQLEEELKPLEAEGENLKNIVDAAAGDAGDAITDFAENAKQDIDKVVNVVDELHQRLQKVGEVSTRVFGESSEIGKVIANGSGAGGEGDKTPSASGQVIKSSTGNGLFGFGLEQMKATTEQFIEERKKQQAEYDAARMEVFNFRTEMAFGITDAFTSAMNASGNFFKNVGEGLQNLGKQILTQVANMLILSTLFRAFGINYDVSGLSISPVFKSKPVNDAVITPKGQVVTTAPDDYLIATKHPESLGGSNVVVNVNNNKSDAEVKTNTYYDGTRQIIDIFIDGLNRDVSGVRGILRAI